MRKGSVCMLASLESRFEREHKGYREARRAAASTQDVITILFVWQRRALWYCQSCELRRRMKDALRVGWLVSRQSVSGRFPQCEIQLVELGSRERKLCLQGTISQRLLPWLSNS